MGGLILWGLYDSPFVRRVAVALAVLRVPGSPRTVAPDPTIGPESSLISPGMLQDQFFRKFLKSFLPFADVFSEFHFYLLLIDIRRPSAVRSRW